MGIVKLLKVSLILYIIFLLLFIQFYFKKLFVTEALNMVTINQDNATILGKLPYFQAIRSNSKKKILFIISHVQINFCIYIPTYIYKKNKNKKSFTDYFLFIYMNLPFLYIVYTSTYSMSFIVYAHPIRLQ